MKEEKNENKQEILKQHSVKISINAKNLWSGEVKTYGQTPGEAYVQTLVLAEKLAVLIKDKNRSE